MRELHTELYNAVPAELLLMSHAASMLLLRLDTTRSQTDGWLGESPARSHGTSKATDTQ